MPAHKSAVLRRSLQLNRLPRRRSCQRPPTALINWQLADAAKPKETKNQPPAPDTRFASGNHRAGAERPVRLLLVLLIIRIVIVAVVGVIRRAKRLVDLVVP